MTNGFALYHDKNLQIYFSCVKRQAKKNDFLKDGKSTVEYIVVLEKKKSPSTQLPSHPHADFIKRGQGKQNLSNSTAPLHPH